MTYSRKRKNDDVTESSSKIQSISHLFEEKNIDLMLSSEYPTTSFFKNIIESIDTQQVVPIQAFSYFLNKMEWEHYFTNLSELISDEFILNKFLDWFYPYLIQNANFHDSSYFWAVVYFIHIVQHSRKDVNIFQDVVKIALKIATTDEKNVVFEKLNLDIVFPKLYLIYFGDKPNLSEIALRNMSYAIFKECSQKYGNNFIIQSFVTILHNFHSKIWKKTSYLSKLFQNKPLIEEIIDTIDSIYILSDAFRFQILSLEDARKTMNVEKCKINFVRSSHIAFMNIFTNDHQHLYGKFAEFLREDSYIYNVFRGNNFTNEELCLLIKTVIPININFFQTINDFELFSYGIKCLPSYEFRNLLRRMTLEFCEIKGFPWKMVQTAFSNYAEMIYQIDKNFLSDLCRENLSPFAVLIISNFIIQNKSVFSNPDLVLLKIYLMAEAFTGKSTILTRVEHKAIEDLYGSNFLNTYLEYLYIMLKNDQIYVRTTGRIYFKIGYKILVFTNFITQSDGFLRNFPNPFYIGIHNIWKMINQNINHLLYLKKERTSDDNDKVKLAINNFSMIINQHENFLTGENLVFSYMIRSFIDYIKPIIGALETVEIIQGISDVNLEILRKNTSTSNFIYYAIEAKNNQKFLSQYHSTIEKKISEDDFIKQCNPNDAFHLKVIEMRKEIIESEVKKEMNVSECSICIELTNSKFILPCGHSFCKCCIYSCLDTGSPKCPTCRNENMQLIEMF